VVCLAENKQENKKKKKIIAREKIQSENINKKII
jgi:hypothetical protein